MKIEIICCSNSDGNLYETWTEQYYIVSRKQFSRIRIIMRFRYMTHRRLGYERVEQQKSKKHV